MSGHAEDPIMEESKRFFTFFNLSMILVAITGIEIVIIYVETFDGSSIIGTLFATSILKFIGVIWWFMHLKWDKFLNTVLFLMGLVIALGTFFAVIYMTDVHPVIDEDGFSVNALEDKWEAGKNYVKGDYVLVEDSYYKANFDHQSPPSFSDQISPGNGDESAWSEVDGVPHLFKWKISHGDLVEINSNNPAYPFFHQYEPVETENIEGEKISLLKMVATKDDFRIRVRSESYLTQWPEDPNQ